ncbi:hypothetical protein [uncultured Sphingomonas sp.]|uniref:hypothetical protein n=1 Tax=uncultured Sphingomonas sp. TaxID=158754 RepID=UPI0025D2D4E6|nr:hypothetical protein [uncultured Sphingomonas sp.]
MSNTQPPPGSNRRAVRIAIVIAVIGAVLWVVTFLGMNLSSYKSIKEDPQPGQQTPAPAPGASR